MRLTGDKRDSASYGSAEAPICSSDAQNRTADSAHLRLPHCKALLGDSFKLFTFRVTCGRWASGTAMANSSALRRFKMEQQTDDDTRDVNDNRIIINRL